MAIRLRISMFWILCLFFLAECCLLPAAFASGPKHKRHSRHTVTKQTAPVLLALEPNSHHTGMYNLYVKPPEWFVVKGENFRRGAFLVIDCPKDKTIHDEVVPRQIRRLAVEFVSPTELRVPFAKFMEDLRPVHDGMENSVTASITVVNPGKKGTKGPSSYPGLFDYSFEIMGG